ncbi:hypothetical protein EOA13_32065 [Mesorhizobium sp. M7A.F.Ca.US.011.01.1.1]|uniref:hypothetical protein n=1 Tax=unclassified Mesorhizobium TaxID=325217 RepID=UPI000FCADAC8|nr:MULTISPECIES: hypothetical protein [unclassified Mesorhizobium]RUW89670.1 hypothetical protein EOA19_24245 [Mesorhizobium sp. M7A.F.Ca.US.010.02.1.1]RUX24057.1 hypothetical protein EOA13_32065 [Mesorhizobium sp. M7A.F.Ca.US.011.01.1.1]
MNRQRNKKAEKPFIDIDRQIANIVDAIADGLDGQHEIEVAGPREREEKSRARPSSHGSR